MAAGRASAAPKGPSSRLTASPQPVMFCCHLSQQEASKGIRNAPGNVLHMHLRGRQLAAQARLYVCRAHAHAARAWRPRKDRNSQPGGHSSAPFLQRLLGVPPWVSRQCTGQALQRAAHRQASGALPRPAPPCRQRRGEAGGAGAGWRAWIADVSPTWCAGGCGRPAGRRERRNQACPGPWGRLVAGEASRCQDWRGRRAGEGGGASRGAAGRRPGLMHAHAGVLPPHVIGARPSGPLSTQTVPAAKPGARRGTPCPPSLQGAIGSQIDGGQRLRLQGTPAAAAGPAAAGGAG